MRPESPGIAAVISRHGLSCILEKKCYFAILPVAQVLSFPGLYSLVKRSVKSKVVRKTYEVAGPAASGA